MIIFLDSLEIWEGRGGEGWQLIDPVDGFHPSQTAQVIQVRVLKKFIF